MKRTKLADRKLPEYTKGEEIFNMVSHIVGGAFGIAALAACLVVALVHRDPWAVAGGAIFGSTMVLLYTMSSLYHGLIPEMAKKVFQVIDHCTIYFLIAGSYTPIILTRLRENNPKVAWILFIVTWAISALAIVLTAIDLNRFKVFSMICYLGIGWSVIFAIKPLLAAYPPAFIAWLVSGGVSYTVGSILYGIGKKRRYMHSTFHLFVLLGSVLHFVGIIMYCM